MSRPTFCGVGGDGINSIYRFEVRHAAFEWTMEHINAKAGKSRDECVSRMCFRQRFPPEKDIKVRVSRRKEFEDVEWDFAIE